MEWQPAEIFILDGDSGLGKIQGAPGCRKEVAEAHFQQFITERQRGLSIFKLKFKAFWLP